MKDVYIGPEQIFGAGFHVIPVHKSDDLIAFGLVWNGQVISVKGFELYLPLAVMELSREHPNVNWEPMLEMAK